MRPAEFPAVPLHGFRGDAPAPASVTRPRGLAVAISREAGARGGTIARKVGELLGWQVFDRDTLEYLTQDDTARAQLLADVPDPAREWADDHLARLQRAAKLTTEPGTVALLRLVLLAAARGDAVIVGRGAGFLLPSETTVHVRIVAPFEARVAYFADCLRMPRAEAAAEVRARDDRRARYLTHAIGQDGTNPTSYDLVVNSARLGIEPTAQFIGWAVRIKQQFAELREPDDLPGTTDPAAPR